MIEITDKEFNQISEYIKRNYGIALKKEKQSLVVGRLHMILEQQKMSSFSEYYKYLISDVTGNAATDLINRISTNHTFFMREQEHFTYFVECVLPYLEKNVKDKSIRIWCAGCSTGEEPYTLAMLMMEYFGDKKNMWDTRILATDISSKVLDTAQQGIYQTEKLDSLPIAWRTKYFSKYDNDRSILKESVRREVILKRVNLMDKTYSFKSGFHIIFCRNVMIYFNKETRQTLVNKFYQNTKLGGFLFIGHSETIDRDKSNYRYIIPAVYRKEY